MSDTTKKPAPAQQENLTATGCLRCEMSYPQTRRCWEHRFDGPLCLLADCPTERWTDSEARYSSSCYCAEHRKGREIAAIDSRFTADHPNPAQPEAKVNGDGKKVITPVQMHWCADKRCRQPGNVKTYPEPEICAGARCRSHCGTEGGCAACITPERLPCIVCGVPLSDKTPGAQEWSFTSQVTGAEKSGLTHEFCVATMAVILSKKAGVK